VKPPLLKGHATTLYHIEPERLRVVGRDTPDGPEHGLWDDHALLPPYEEYVQSAMAFGILEPVITTVVDGIAYVVDGRRRVVAAREANVRLAALKEPQITVPVVAKDGARVSFDTYATVLVMLNEIRRDDSAVVKMRKAARLTARGVPIKLIEIAFGVSRVTISDWACVAAACPEVQKALDAEEVGLQVATRVARLPLAQQPAALLQLLALAPAARTVVVATSIVRSIQYQRKRRMRPAIPVIRMVLAYEDKLPADFLRGLRFMLGEMPPEEMPGLPEILARPMPPHQRKRGSADEQPHRRYA